MRVPKVARLLLAGALAAGLSMAWPTAAQAVTIDPYAYQEIYPPFISPTSPKCLDVPGGTTTQGTALQIFHCHGYASNGAPQLFEFIPKAVDGATVYKMVNLASGLCLAPGTADGGDPPTVGTLVKQYSCTSNNVFEWYVDPDPRNPNYDFKLRSWYFPNLCISAANNYGDDHTPVVLYACNVYDDFHDIMTWRIG